MASAECIQPQRTEDPYAKVDEWLEGVTYASPRHLVVISYASRMRIYSELLLTEIEAVRGGRMEDIRKMKILFRKNDLSRAENVEGYAEAKNYFALNLAIPMMSAEIDAVTVPDKYEAKPQDATKYKYGLAFQKLSGRLSGIERKIGRTNVTIPKAPAVRPRV